MARITVLGSGGFGTALAVLCHKNGHDTTLWSLFEDEISEIKKDRENKKLLPNIKLSEEINLTSDISCTENADAVIFAVPSFAVRSTAHLVAEKINKNAVVINVAKGFEPETLKRLSEVLSEELSENKIVAVSGPSHAEEIALEMPTTVVAASDDKDAAMYAQNLLMNNRLRIYCNDDVVGVELGGALKNIIALAAGIVDGLGFGDNTKAALMTRGMAEISRLGLAMGARMSTFSGLTGIGDLIVTCTSMHSRNRRAGILIGKGTPATDAIKEIGMTVEGYISSKSAYELAKRYNVEMPIIEEVYKVLYENADVNETVTNLMTRPNINEFEEVWNINK